MKLIDFGIAQDLMGMSLRDRETSGTPKYMSPEQKLGRYIGHKTDIYSLGITVKEILEVLQDSISAETQSIISKAISQKPRKRPASASKFINDLCKTLIKRDR